MTSLDDKLLHARETVALAQRSLGLKPTGDYNIDEKTSRRLVEFLEDAQRNNPALAAQYRFSPYTPDSNAKKFVVALLMQQADAAGIPRQNFQQNIFDLWNKDIKGGSLSEVSKTASIFSVLRYMNDGVLPKLPPEDRFEPTVVAPWKQPSKPDETGRFFNAEVYRELGLYDAGQLLQGIGSSNTVTHKALFHPTTADAAQQKMIAEVARDLNIQPIDPKAEVYRYSQNTIARMSTEILSRQARALCVTSESDITKAIMTQQYMPHIVDLKLAEMGFGKDAKWSSTPQLNELRRTGVIPPGDGLPEERFDLYRTAELSAAQSAKWGARFGKIDEVYVQQIAATKVGTNATVTDGNGTNPRSGLDWVRETHQSPFSYIDPAFFHGRQRHEDYSKAREAIFLPRFNWRVYNGLDLCRFDGSSMPTPPANTAIGANDGKARNGGVIPRASSGATDTSTAGPGSATACAANSIFVCSDKVKDNAQDSTGQTGTQPPAACTISGPFVCDTKKPAAAPGVK